LLNKALKHCRFRAFFCLFFKKYVHKYIETTWKYTKSTQNKPSKCEGLSRFSVVMYFQTQPFLG
jgi:hypothetical protein